MHKPAQNDYEIHTLLQARWSPRAFSPRPVEEEKLWSLFEAARWSPSGGNGQPWAFVVARKTDTETHTKLVSLLMGFNTVWAKNAPVLILTAGRLNPDKPEMTRYVYYDVGQAVAHLSVQASALGLHVHQMAGFDREKAHPLFGLPVNVEALTLLAVGYYGDADTLPDELRQREYAPRARKSLSDFVFEGAWGHPLGQPAPDLSAQ
jgi:nitroreductase